MKARAGQRVHSAGVLNSRAGFTLVEVLVALIILVIGLLGVALLQVTSISGNTFSREMATATTLAQDLLEKLKTLEWTETFMDDALSAGPHPIAVDLLRDLDGDGNPPFLSVGITTDNIIDERGLGAINPNHGVLLYTRLWSVQDDTPALNMKTITVTVSWKDPKRRQAGLPDPQVQISGVKVRE